MKSSKYNFFFDVEKGKKLALNSSTSGLAILSNDEFEIVQALLENPDNFRHGTKKQRELRGNLKKGGFLIFDEDDEFLDLKLKNRIGRFDHSSLGLTIAPTLDCNFNCIYCYENKKKVSMNQDVEKALVKFVKKKIKKCDSLHVSWYGGEPTLRIKQIDRLTKKFVTICKKNGLSYHAGLVSNGYLLNKNMAEKLKELSIKSVQITLDGPKDVHDKMRPLRNGKGTFNQIIKNVQEILNILKVSVRININKNNKEKVLDLIQYLERLGLKNRVSIYFAPVAPYTDICADMADNCYSGPEFAELESLLYRRLIERGFNHIPTPRLKYGSYCAADRLNSYVINPSGYIFKCWNEISISEDNSIGNLLQKQTPLQRKIFRKWLLWDPFENKNCIECKILPLCNGGCPYLAYKMSENNSDQENCSRWKYNMERMLNLAYIKYLKKMEGKNEIHP